MKPLYFLLISLVCIAMLRPPTGPSFPATVVNKSGVATYVYCLPDRPFDTVCTLSTKTGLNSYAGPSSPNRVVGLDRPLDALVRQAVRKETRGPKKKRQDISGIITFDARTAVAIRFTTKVKDLHVNRSKVYQYKGYYVFVRSRPEARYESLSRVRLNDTISLGSDGYPAMSALLDSLIIHYEKTAGAKKANALLTDSGLEAEFIQLNHQ